MNASLRMRMYLAITTYSGEYRSRMPSTSSSCCWRLLAFVTGEVERHLEFFGQRPQQIVAAHDGQHVGFDIFEGVANEQIAQTMRLLRNHDNNVFLALFGQAHVVAGRQHVAEILNIGKRRGLTGKLRPHKEAPGFVVNKFAVGHDVQAAAKKHAGDLVDDTGFVRAIDGENVVLHVEANPLTR